MNTVKSFIKQFVAAVKGDDAEAKAQKAYRQVGSALNSQIAVLEGESVDRESAIDTAKENLSDALVNKGYPISDRNQYVRNLLDLKNKLTEAEEAKEKHDAKLDFLKNCLVDLDKEVSAE